MSDETPHRPLFLSPPSAARTLADDEQSLGDWEEATDEPERPLKARSREVARLLFLGKSRSEIAELIGCSPDTISRVTSNPRVRREVERLHDQVFERTVGERLKELGPDALSVIEEGLRSPKLKMRDRVALAQWVAEKLDGKAGQKMDLQSSTLEKFLEVLGDMSKRGEVIDVSPGPKVRADVVSAPVEGNTSDAPSGPDWSNWVDSNI